ncbi:MAG: hypothetical protein NZ898_11995 [Myxococcota bacterium]|nr:hypothetical protein [Myxococcota bacterium]MDW8360917.1 hypothetical protein [Myxococcales bacterium]
MGVVLWIAGLPMARVGVAQSPEIPSTPEAAAPPARLGDLEEEQRNAEDREARLTAGGVVEPGARPATTEDPDGPLHHGGQGALRIGLARPYVFAVRYDDGPHCGSFDESGEPETFCRRAGAWLLDVGLGYGVLPALEVDLLVRIGLSRDDAARRAPLQLGPGIRAHPSPDGQFKLALGARLVVDYTPAEQPRWKELDVGLRGEVGLQLDLSRHFGLFGGIGVQIVALRGLYFTFDGGAGIQVRYP